MGSYIIVGQGLAGSILAYTLHKKGHTVTVIDKDSGAGSSRVAAGIFHPLVFKRTTLTWKSAELFNFLEGFYPELETELGTTFYYPLPYIRLFASQGEKDNWLKFKPQAEYQNFLGEYTNAPANPYIKSTFGAGHLQRSGWVNTNKLLDAIKSYFTKNKILINSPFDYNLIELNDNKVGYNGLVADKIIFCEGYGINQNPYFNYLPLKPTKGQMLTIATDDLPSDKIFNRKVFILPLGNGEFRMGSNYEWEWQTEEPTEEIKQELLERLAELADIEFEVKNHEAGIRPSVHDRRPLIGLHPTQPQLAVFNGMGSKGICLAPFFANQFAGYLAGTKELDKEANITRFNT